MKSLLLAVCLGAPIAVQASPMFDNPTVSSGCGVSNPSIAKTAATMQVSGGGVCPGQTILLAPPSQQNPGGIASFSGMGGNVLLQGSGSGAFDMFYFPIGFTAFQSPATLFNAVFSINGTPIHTFTQQTQGLADVGPALNGVSLVSWSVQITGNPVGLTFPLLAPPPSNGFGFCVFLGSNTVCNTSTNNSPSNPRLPDTPVSGGGGGGTGGGGTGGGGGLTPPPPTWVFTGVPNGCWCDPPFVSGFSYVGTGGTLFDRITLPTGYGSSFMVYNGSMLLGTFGAGAAVDFAPGGLGSFEIKGINPTVDAALPNAFPLQVFFEGGGVGSFTQTGIEDVSEVPEPSTWMLGISGVALLVWRRRS